MTCEKYTSKILCNCLNGTDTGVTVRFKKPQNQYLQLLINTKLSSVKNNNIIFEINLILK